MENRIINYFLIGIIHFLLAIQEFVAKILLDRNINNSNFKVNSKTMKKILVVLFERVDKEHYYYYDNDVFKKFYRN